MTENTNMEINLDDISVKILELMDEIIERKKEAEELMRDGYFMIGKSRYIMGVQSVSLMQIPNEDCNVEACLYTSVSEISEFDGFPFSFHKFDLHKSGTSKVLGNLHEEAKGDTTLRKRGGTEVEEISKKDGDNRDKNLNLFKATDPLRWFSALPPQSLRQAQQYFKRTIVKLMEVATLQNQLHILQVQSKKFECEVPT